MFDKDGDGALSIPELRDALRKLGINLSEHDFNKLVRHLQKRVEKDEKRDKEKKLRQQRKEAILLGKPLPEGEEIDIQAFLNEQKERRNAAHKKKQSESDKEENKKQTSWAMQEAFGAIKNPAKVSKHRRVDKLLWHLHSFQVGKKEAKYSDTREAFLRRVAELEMRREMKIAEKVASELKDEEEVKEKVIKNLYLFFSFSERHRLSRSEHI